MKNLAFILLLLSTLSASAIDRITLTLTVTNTPVTGNTLVVNASSRFWTNAQSSTTFATNLVGLGPSTTNLFNQITANAYSGPLILRYTGTNSIQLIGTLGGALSASAAGNWASLVLSTQSGPSTFTALYPLENIVGETNRTNQASAFVAGLNSFATNLFNTNATALGNYLSKGASPLQTVTAPVSFQQLTNSTNKGTIYGGTLRNGTLANQEASLLTLSSTNSQIWFTNGPSGYFGVRLVADTNGVPSLILAGGEPMDIQDTFGYVNLENVLNLATAVRAFPKLDDAFSGFTSTVNTWSNSANHYLRSTVYFHLGFTATNPVVYGGWFVSPTNYNTVNSNSVSIGTNRFDLAVSFSRTNITSLANGANDLDPGFKTYLRVSGPSGAYSIDKIDRGWDGRFLRIQKNDSLTMTILNESGAGVLGDAAKIRTGTGGTVTITNNPGVAEFTYDADLSRWVLGYRSN